MNQEPARPRAQHYDFAHKLLPYIAIHEADDLIADVAARGDKAIEHLYAIMHTHNVADPKERIDPKEIHWSLRKVGDWNTAVVITMPTPAVTPEAYFVAVISCMNPGGTPPSTGRCFCLELTTDEDGKPAAVLCEWIGKSHRNYGRFVEPNEDDFVGAIQDRLKSG